MMRRALFAIFAWALLSAQTGEQLGFPPGTFQERAALDAAAGGGSTVQFDASGFTGIGSSPTSPKTISALIDVGSGGVGTANRALIFAVSFFSSSTGTISGVSVTWNGTSMSSIGSFTSSSNSDMFIFGLTAPATGSNNFVLTWTGAANGSIAVAALSVVGADQTGGATTFKNFTTNTATGTPATVTVSSATGEICFAGHEVPTTFSTGSGSDIGHDNGGAVSAFAANRDAGAASTTLTYTNSSAQFASMGVCIKAAP